MKYTNLFKYLSSITLILLISLYLCSQQSWAIQSQPLHNYYPNENIFASFRLVKNIYLEPFTIPTVIEFPLSTDELQQQPFIMYDVDSDKPIGYFINTTEGLPPVTVSRERVATDLLELHDQNAATFYEVPLIGKGDQTIFYYTSTVPITASSLRVTLSPNAYPPDDVTIFNFQGVGQLNTIVSHVSFNSGNIQFPQNTSNNWQILFSYSQPLRISELEIVPDHRIVQENSAFRFLAEPNHQYRLYLSPDHAIQTPTTEYVNLADTPDNLTHIPEPKSDPNSFYIKADIDQDGVPDDIDNCPGVANPDQKDINTNKIGDTCEDFDHDGILNYRDNCPNSPNVDQKDRDSDGAGDVCDLKESRLTERIWWLPWLGIVVGFGTVLGIFAVTVKAKKIKD